MNIAYFLTPKCETAYLYDDDTLRQGLEKMKYHGYAALPVIDRQGRYIGTISEGEFLWFIITGEYNDVEKITVVEHIDVKQLEDLKIKDLINTEKYPSVSAMSDLSELFEIALNQNFVPVVDDRGFFMGIVTRQRIIKKLTENN